jgi:DNA end-binding protein Ku
MIRYKSFLIPVALYTATKDNDVKFNLLHRGCNTKIIQKRFCPTCNVDVEYADVVKGKEVEEGKFVAIEKEEIEKLNGDNDKRIEIINFVNPNEIPSVYSEKSYYLSPDKNGERNFILLKDALRESEKGALGTFTMRSKKHLVLLTPYENVIALTQLFFADEVKDTKALEYKLDMPSKEEMKAGIMMVEKGLEKFDVSEYKNETAEALVNLIAEKAEAEEKPKVKGKGKKALLSGDVSASKLMDMITASMEEPKVKAKRGK